MEAGLMVDAKPSLFATNYRELVGRNHAAVDERQRSAAARGKKEAAAKRMSEREEKLRFVQNITAALAHAGEDIRLERGGAPIASFLQPSLSGYPDQPVVAEELAPPELANSTLPVVPLAEVLHADCPNCEKGHPVIQVLRELAPSGELLEVRVLLCPASKDIEAITILHEIR